MTHYYTDNQNLKSNRKKFNYSFNNESFIFTTDNGVFSKEDIDYGSYLLIKNICSLDNIKEFLDLGSGYGPIGIIYSRFHPESNITMVDINSRAIELSKLNSELNKTKTTVIKTDDIVSLNNKFDIVALNPPIRTGKDNIYNLYEKSYEVLNNNGSLYIVIQKKQGADSSYKKLKDLFKEVKLIDRSHGYHIYQAIK